MDVWRRKILFVKHRPHYPGNEMSVPGTVINIHVEDFIWLYAEGVWVCVNAPHF